MGRTRQKTQPQRKKGAQKPESAQRPVTLWAALLDVLWGLPPFIRNALLIAVALLVSAFALVSLVPDSIKTDIYTKLRNPPPSPAETPALSTGNANSPSPAATNRNAPIPPAASQPKQERRASRNGSAAAPEQTAPGSLQGELESRGMIGSIRQANNYAAAGNREGREEALKLYRSVIGRLSGTARSQLDQALLRGAEQDFKDGNNDESVRKYRKLFAAYL